MDSITEYQKLKSRIEDWRRKADRLQGSLDQMLSELKEKYGCNSIEKAKALLAKLEKEMVTEERKLKRILESYNKKWGKQLEETL